MSGGKKVKVKCSGRRACTVGNHELEEKAREQSVDAYIARTVREDDEDDELGLAMAVSRDAAMLTEGSAGSSAAGPPLQPVHPPPRKWSCSWRSAAAKGQGQGAGVVTKWTCTRMRPT